MRWLPFMLASEWLIVRGNGQRLGPYALEENALRDLGQWKGASLYRRRVIRARCWRLLPQAAITAAERDAEGRSA